MANRQGLDDLDRLRRTGGGPHGPRTPPPSQAYRDNYDAIFRKKPPPCSCGRCIACVPRNPLLPVVEG